MVLAQVVGTVVSTRKDPALVGLKLLLTREVDEVFHATGSWVVAADAVGAGIGELVLVAAGSSARLTDATKEKPVDAVIAGIVDSVEVAGRVAYRKSATVGSA